MRLIVFLEASLGLGYAAVYPNFLLEVKISSARVSYGRTDR